MIGLYKDLKAAYLISLVLLCCLTAATVFFAEDAFGTVFFWIMVVIFAVCIALALIAQKRMDAIQKDLLENGRAWDCIRAYETLLNRPAAQKKAVRRVLRFNMGTAYSAIGDQRRAIQLTMEFLPIKANTKRGKQEQLAYCNNMAEYYLLAGDTANAKAAIADVKLALREFDTKHPQAICVRANLTGMECHLAVLEGEAHGVYRTLEIEHANATTPYRRVASGYTLALAYLQLGEAAKAVPVLETMVTQGGDTFYTAWAAERLKEWQKT